MKHSPKRKTVAWGLLGLVATVSIILGISSAQESKERRSSYAPVAIKEDFATIMARMKAAKSEVMTRQMDPLKSKVISPMTKHARVAFLASRTNFVLSFPMLFFMATASHYPLF